MFFNENLDGPYSGLPWENRYYGNVWCEEFVILLPAREVKSGVEMAEKIRINVELLGVQCGQH